MKKIICLALVLSMAFAFTACGSKSGGTNGDSSSILDSSAVSADTATETSVEPTTGPTASSAAESSATVGTETSSTEASSAESTASSSADGTIKAAISNAPDVNIRAEANTNCSIVGTAAEGDAYEVVSEDDGTGFIGINYNGTTCYISSTYAYIDTVTEDELTVVTSADSDSEESDGETSSGVTAETTRENEDGMKR